MAKPRSKSQNPLVCKQAHTFAWLSIDPREIDPSKLPAIGSADSRSFSILPAIFLQQPTKLLPLGLRACLNTIVLDGEESDLQQTTDRFPQTDAVPKRLSS